LTLRHHIHSSHPYQPPSILHSIQTPGQYPKKLHIQSQQIPHFHTTDYCTFEPIILQQLLG
ncbi:hypothetical protein, partial [Schleiferia thermophila]